MQQSRTDDVQYQPPLVSVRKAQDLNQNVKNLREQLTNIHKLINQTQDITEVTYEEVQDKNAAEDISAMAVYQLSATTQVQNKQMKQEIEHLRE